MPLEWPWKIEAPPPVTPGLSSGQMFVDVVIISVLGFFLIAGLIVKFGIPFFRTLFAERRKAIVEATQQVQQTLDETNRMLTDYRNRLEGIEDETERRLQEAVREADTLREQILAEAKENVQLIIRRGHDEVSRERAKARLHLRSQFVEDTIAAAGYAAERSLNAESQRRLVDDFVANLGAGA